MKKLGHWRDAEAAGAHLAPRPRIKVLGVDYLHLQMDDGSDLYVTDYGLPFAGLLLPHNYWTDEDWFAAHSARLQGSSTLYRITTKETAGQSKEIVLKWNRMGQDIPGETEASELDNVQFNSPFEEFGLAIELRKSGADKTDPYRFHKPLAVYVPRKYVEMDRLGRRPDRIEAMQRNHNEVMLDAHRQYAVLYEWIDGIDALEALNERLIDENALSRLLSQANRELERRGFRVRDSKPQHIIVKPSHAGKLSTDACGNVLCALVDFELLERTPEHEQHVRGAKRKSYLVKQAHRFETKGRFPPGLKPVTIMGVDYVSGPVESTGGALWVVGRDPVLFDYFLPEKWRRTPRKRISVLNRVYDTITKDSIHLVWRVCRVGERPDLDPFLANEREILAYGYNSPFEEMAFAIELAAKGIDTSYPRAVYRSGHKSEVAARILDKSRFESHEALKTEDGHPVLGTNHDYITLWGYWNGPDELLAEKDEEYFRGIDALRALREGLITEEVYIAAMHTTQQRLAEVGVEDLDLRGNHLLLSVERSGRLVLDKEGVPASRICSFALLRHIDPKTKPPSQPLP
ncbi:MAG: hypothetical protein V2A58_13660 [Planctomycetota bacterium]